MTILNSTSKLTALSILSVAFALAFVIPSQADVIPVPDFLNQAEAYNFAALDFPDISGEESIYVIGTTKYVVAGSNGFQLTALDVPTAAVPDSTGFPLNYCTPTFPGP